MELKQQRFCLARKTSNFTQILDKVLKAEPVYVKGTGIRVMITDIDFHKGQRSVHGRVKFLGTPTKKALMKCEQCNIDIREDGRPLGAPAPTPPTYNISVQSVIDLDNLSVTPYETKAAKILYKK